MAIASLLFVQEPIRNPASAAEYQWRVVSVYDGDTATVQPPNSPPIHIRIMGLDAPEMHARCPAELRLALAAKRLMQTLLSGDVTFEPHSTDKYRRTLAIVRLGGVDVAQIMIGAGLAREYHGEHRKPWCD